MILGLLHKAVNKIGVVLFQRKGGEEPAEPVPDVDGSGHSLYVLQRAGHGGQHHGDFRYQSERPCNEPIKLNILHL